MNNKLINLYDDLNLDNKKSELNSLILEIGVIVFDMASNLPSKEIMSFREYNKLNHSNLSESELLTFYYENLMYVKNQLLMIEHSHKK